MRVRDSWTGVELDALKRAVAQHGRDWDTVASCVGTRNKAQCQSKVVKEVVAGRMEEPGGKIIKESWSKLELNVLKRAVALHGRNWSAISRCVGTKTSLQCSSKVDVEVTAGRMEEPGGKLVKDSWTKVELSALKLAVALHGRDWVAVASSFGSKTRQQCKRKVDVEVAAGRMPEPGGKRSEDVWSESELIRLRNAIDRHGRDWASVASDVGSKTKDQCCHKVQHEVAAGRMQEPGGKQVHNSWSNDELVRLRKAVDRHGQSWVAVALDVGTKSRLQCFHKVQREVAAGRWSS
jgi:hypothetical protein